MAILNTLVQAHMATNPGWDLDGPADMATWVRDATDNEVVVFESGNDALDIANAAFIVQAHQALPIIAQQVNELVTANQALLELLGASGESLTHMLAPEAAAELQSVLGRCRQAMDVSTVGYLREMEFKVNIPGADAETRSKLFENTPTKAQAIALAADVLKGTNYPRAVIFRVELNEEGHVVSNEICQYVPNPEPATLLIAA